MAEEKTETKHSWFDGRFFIIGICIFLLAGGIAFGVARMVMSSQSNPVTVEQVVRGPLVEAGEFVVNIADGQGPRFLKTEIVLEIIDSKQEKQLEEDLPIVQDCILSFLSSKTVDDLAVGQRERLKIDMLERINGVLGGNLVTMVYFTTFIMQ